MLTITRISITILVLAAAVELSAQCACWFTEHTDDWTDEYSINMVCANVEQETGLAISVPDSELPRLEFYDPSIRAQNSTLVTWQYRVGQSERKRISFYWNTEVQIGGSTDAAIEVLSGIQNEEKVIFRFNPLSPSQETGQTHTIYRCEDGSILAKEFLPFVQQHIAELEETEDG